MNHSNKFAEVMASYNVRPSCYDIVASILRYRPTEARATLTQLQRTRPDLFEEEQRLGTKL